MWGIRDWPALALSKEDLRGRVHKSQSQKEEKRDNPDQKTSVMSQLWVASTDDQTEEFSTITSHGMDFLELPNKPLDFCGRALCARDLYCSSLGSLDHWAKSQQTPLPAFHSTPHSLIRRKSQCLSQISAISLLFSVSCISFSLT